MANMREWGKMLTCTPVLWENISSAQSFNKLSFFSFNNQGLIHCIILHWWLQNKQTNTQIIPYQLQISQLKYKLMLFNTNIPHNVTWAGLVFMEGSVMSDQVLLLS